MKFPNKLQLALTQRKANGNLRSLPNKNEGIDFASCDYLGLARSKLFTSDEVPTIPGWIPSGSRLLTGNSRYVEELETSIAKFHQFQAGLIYSSGYMANIGLLSAILHEGDLIFFDREIHASMHDGMRLGKAECFSFRHNDCDHLEKRLQKTLRKGNLYVCIESVYSVDGSIAPLETICRLCERYGAYLIVDEAHSIGWMGKKGEGLVAEKQLQKQIFALVVSFSKALGCQGGIVLGNSFLKEYLVNFSHMFIYTAALSHQSLVAIKTIYDILPSLTEERERLVSLFSLFYKFSTPIKAIRIAGNDAVKEAAKSLKEAGFFVSALTSPTVRRGEECLRICLHSYNSEEEVRMLISVLKRYL